MKRAIFAVLLFVLIIGQICVEAAGEEKEILKLELIRGQEKSEGKHVITYKNPQYFTSSCHKEFTMTIVNKGESNLSFYVTDVSDSSGTNITTGQVKPQKTKTILFDANNNNVPNRHLSFGLTSDDKEAIGIMTVIRGGKGIETKEVLRKKVKKIESRLPNFKDALLGILKDSPGCRGHEHLEKFTCLYCGVKSMLEERENAYED